METYKVSCCFSAVEPKTLQSVVHLFKHWAATNLVVLESE